MAEREEQAKREELSKREEQAKRPSLVLRVIEEVKERFSFAPDERAPLESAFETLAVMADRLRAVPSSSIADPLGDRVARVGSTVELSAHFAPTGMGVTDELRFFVDGAPVGIARTEGVGHALLPYRAEKAGVHQVAVDLAPGTKLRSLVRVAALRLQVLAPGERAVLVDGDLLLEDAARTVALLRALIARGFALILFDRAAESRVAEVHARAARLGLPPSAVLRPLREPELAPMGADFAETFIRANLRRLLAHEIPVGLVLSANEAVVAAARAEGLDALGPREIEARAAANDPAMEWLAPIERRASERAALREKAPSLLAWRLDVMTRSVARKDNRCRVELDNRRARRQVLEAIGAARQWVLLQVYIFEESRFADELCVTLIRRARAGVQVRVMVDALYSADGVLGVKNPLIDVLRREANIEVVAADAIPEAADLALVRLKVRDHRKLIVVDDRRAFVSGRNVGDRYYTGFEEVPVADHTPDDRIPWLDAHLEIEGPLVAEVRATFAATWERNGGSALPPPSAAPPSAGPPSAATGAEGEGGGALRLVVHEGVHDNHAMAAYEAIIDSARDHVIIVNDFPIVWTLAWAIRRALARGVRVDFLTGCAIARRGDGHPFEGSVFRRLFEHFTKARIEPLVQEGVRVFEYVVPELPNIVASGGRIRPYVHAKIVTADGLVASVGSANLDGAASYWEHEASVVIEGGPVPARLEHELLAIIAGSARIDLESEYWKREAAQRALVARLWPESVYS
ncbi:MAG: phosphatidylserine/phosphatidylglycerophosphate/cardiolipin synthase family protein [Deltaproteobacteria bacterium]|nr:phosphatidylserine/phosphatidylglycerophosphate/cardiolipin synthase family protein [Deltaproteobacteria bacterium]